MRDKLIELIQNAVDGCSSYLCDRENGNEVAMGLQMAVQHNLFCKLIYWLKQPVEEEA